jgi:hypothetical protein
MSQWISFVRQAFPAAEIEGNGPYALVSHDESAEALCRFSPGTKVRLFQTQDEAMLFAREHADPDSSIWQFDAPG